MEKSASQAAAQSARRPRRKSLAAKATPPCWLTAPAQARIPGDAVPRSHYPQSRTARPVPVSLFLSRSRKRENLAIYSRAIGSAAPEEPGPEVHSMKCRREGDHQVGGAGLGQVLPPGHQEQTAPSPWPRTSLQGSATGGSIRQRFCEAFRPGPRGKIFGRGGIIALSPLFRPFDLWQEGLTGDHAAEDTPSASHAVNAPKNGD